MRLFCAIGWHKANPYDRWNSGYYFTRCQACGQDLVRRVAGRWHVPKGYRVVWKSKYEPETLPVPGRFQLKTEEWSEVPSHSPIGRLARGLAENSPRRGEDQAEQVPGPARMAGTGSEGVRIKVPASESSVMASSAIEDVAIDDPNPARESPDVESATEAPTAPLAPPGTEPDSVAFQRNISRAPAGARENSSAELPSERVDQSSMNDDDFMQDDAIAWPQPSKPAFVDVDHDFMDVPDDIIFGDRSNFGPDPDHVDERPGNPTAAPEDLEPESKTPKARRSRKKAADTL
ncbi:hypothetical protein [Sphingosinicella rhizophila]|uniref:Uncharacterized protein n=1 Tax=Sphingosinicella rhizophila TaxID=3050082 RepID=A0ABU3Q5H2_9SPHN|nr:hypothetical protein [Sphingosinicella sp. GR2756]MDT9598180.1 hypothetical protein [Sphingosinicella sp. GR2756]